jgi:hypothetical protein
VSCIIGRIVIGFRVQAKLNCTVLEELRLEVFDEIELRRTFGPEAEEAKGGWRQLRNEPRGLCSDHILLR